MGQFKNTYCVLQVSLVGQWEDNLSLWGQITHTCTRTQTHTPLPTFLPCGLLCVN